MNKHYLKLIAFVAVFVSCAFCFLPATAQEYIFNHITTKDGLSSNRVYAVIKDRQGYLWIGTETGLQRYDGNNFIYPKFGNDNSVYDHAVHQIIEDKKGNIWLRMGATIGIFDTHTFRFRITPIRFAKQASVPVDYRLLKDADGNVFVVAIGHCWLYFDDRTFCFEQNKAPFVIPDSLLVTSVYDDRVNKVIWAYGRRGIVAYDKKEKAMYTAAYNPKQLPFLGDKELNHEVTAIYIDNKRRYWVVNWDLVPGRINQNIRCYDEKQRTFTNDNEGTSRLFYRYAEYDNLAEFADSNLIVYGEGCFILNQGHRFEKFYDSPNSMYNIYYNTVYDVYEDKNKLLWVATDNGLYNTQTIIKQNAHLILDSKKSRAEINSLLEYINRDGSKQLWIGTWGARGVIATGKTVYEKSDIDIYANQGFSNSDFGSIWDMHQHSVTGKVWLGCQHGKMQIFDPVTNKSAYYNLPVFGGATIRQITEDKNGNLWLGLQNGNVFRWNKGSTIADSSFHFIMSTGFFVTNLYIDKKGLLWVCSAGKGSAGKGCIVMNTDNMKIVHQYVSDKGQNRISDNSIRQVLQINDSIYALAGSVLNLLNINTNKVNLIYPADDKPIGQVLTLQTDSNNQIWLSTITGIYKYNKERNTYKQYNQQDGLINVENEDYTLTRSLKLSNGNLAFGGGQNLVVFDPKQYSSVEPPTNVTITGIALFAKNLPVDSLFKEKKIEFAHTQNSITIHFASLDFNQLNKLTYYYKLEGADKDWIAADQFLATYNLLPPGNYTFKVKAQNEEGIYSLETTEFHFYIRPSFWQSVWFYILLAMVTAGLLYYWHWLRLQRALQVERVRSRLARDLHDDMGSTLSTINILSNMALQKASSDEKTTKEFISRISSHSSRMMEAMDDIVWSINPVNDSMQKVSARMKEFAGNALEAQDINYTFHVDDAVKEIEFNMDRRRGIFLIFKEAINNILKYAEATDVCIEMALKKKEMVLSIKDNGKGFDPNKPVSTSRGNGVKNMQKRAETMKAYFHLQTAIGEGTCIQLRIPV